MIFLVIAIPAQQTFASIQISSSRNFAAHSRPDNTIQMIIEELSIFAKDFADLMSPKFHSHSKIVTKPSSRMTGSNASITRVPPNGPADTPQIPTAL